MSSHFSPAAIKFLRGLKKNNDRLWFGARKSLYEAEIKAPMLALIAEVNEGLAGFAPAFVRDPARSMMRIYRDIRFSPDKRPYKTHAAAWWARAGMRKTSGAGFYFDLSATKVTIAAGCYMPEREQLLAIRRMLLERHDEVRAALAGKKLKGKLEPSDGLPLARAPKGFPADHPAADLILQRQWGLRTTLPAAAALEGGLAKVILERFRLAAPLVEVLNASLLSPPKSFL